ncbi:MULTISPECIES: sigma-54-dependent transcriptional regulator [Desulfococcus]|jgi:two-component system response regulator GlrR|nr:sigma-54 dependent transcriptional regulator [Desulfococcus multivorans]AOY57754.1 two component system response regulator, sigma54-specific [Desulfococcus multivorans]MDX9817508.1 sigma-54 dependent transcriptional regulator [Desulfococcus multivorans]
MNDVKDQRYTATILTVDDEPSILEVMRMRLGSHGYRVLPAANGREALALAKDNIIDLAVIDYKLDGEDGVSLMEKLQVAQPDLPVIILTAYGTIAKAVDAVKRGASNYLTKPFDGEELLQQIAACLEKAVPDRGKSPFETDAGDLPGACARIIARSSLMKAVLAKVARAAVTDANVYIEGESGTGKELIARCLHGLSTRKSGPFIAINCAAIPENLLESELLGYEKGAFTSADRRREGLFARADGGSFFFDEISELSLPMQAKILRILEEREFYPLGGNKKITVDVRIIAASNRNLEKRIQEGLFREDLFYRIHVIPILLPPLRDRKEDILPLAEHFLAEFSEGSGKSIKTIEPAVVRKLMESKWPGNVRELENVMEYAVAMAAGDTITSDLITGPMDEKDTIPSFRDAKETFEKEYLIQLLELSGGNVSQAAKTAGKYRADFYVLLRKHGLDPMDFRDKR